MAPTLTKGLVRYCRADLRESFRARWYQIYAGGIATTIALFFFFGLAESQVMGFTGLGRLLLAFIQICLVLVPIFVLVTTARTMVGDRESGVWEYELSLPINLRSYFWGRVLGRFLSVLLPLWGALLGASLLSLVFYHSLPWSQVLIYAGLLFSLVAFFIGLSFWISVRSSQQEMAIGLSFAAWLGFSLFIDAILLGLLLKERIFEDALIWAALLNPMQGFRIASLALFDPDLAVLGPIAYTLTEKFGTRSLTIWSCSWSIFLAVLLCESALRSFQRKDLL